MSESREHIELIKVAYNYIVDNIAGEYKEFIETDSSDGNRPEHVINNYIPDIFYCYDTKLVIGEAKTLQDFDRKHSYEQFEAYIAECEAYPGHSFLIVSVPWQIFIEAKNYFVRLKRKRNLFTKIIVINEAGVSSIV